MEAMPPLPLKAQRKRKAQSSEAQRSARYAKKKKTEGLVIQQDSLSSLTNRDLERLGSSLTSFGGKEKVSVTYRLKAEDVEAGDAPPGKVAGDVVRKSKQTVINEIRKQWPEGVTSITLEAEGAEA